MPSLPTPVRAALGVVAVARDTVQSLPDKAIELPMLAVSTALQLSLRAQQRYAALAARGDELLAGQRTTDEPPPWARFDEPAPEVSDEVSAEISAEISSAVSAEISDEIPDEVSDEPRPVHRPRNGAPSAFDAVEE